MQNEKVRRGRYLLHRVPIDIVPSSKWLEACLIRAFQRNLSELRVLGDFSELACTTSIFTGLIAWLSNFTVRWKKKPPVRNTLHQRISESWARSGKARVNSVQGDFEIAPALSLNSTCAREPGLTFVCAAK